MFAKLLQDVSARVEALNTSSLHDPGITHVPQTPAEGDTHKLKLAPWMLGFRATDSSKGKSKLIQLFKCLIEFLEKLYASVKDPIDVLMPLGVKKSAAKFLCSAFDTPWDLRSLSPFASSYFQWWTFVGRTASAC